MSKRMGLVKHNRIVVKVGTTTLTYSNGKLNLRTMEQLACVLSDLTNRGKEIILVSSGAIAVGAERLGLAKRPRDIKGKQAASAVGQVVLMQIYHNFFMSFNQKVAQILFTKDILEIDERRKNAKNAFNTLISMGIIPIVNENDTVSTDELGFSDNDMLSAYVATLVKADCLIILSDIDGLFSEDPKKNPDASIISYIENISDEIESMAGSASSLLGSGGMKTKISAAKYAVDNGIDTVIAKGEKPQIITDILNGEDIGTIIVSKKQRDSGMRNSS